MVEAIRDWTGCRRLGIRLVDPQANIPYEAYIGFSREFWELENRLSLHTDQCLCTRMIRTTPEPHELPVLTPGGSFRCDNAAEFVAGLSSEQQASYRGNCVKVGFRSLAVIPIRYHDQVLGVIHMADERPDMVPVATIEFLESMTPLVGEAVHRFSMEDELARHVTLCADCSKQASIRW